MSEKIGIIGGSFDPIHLGHLIIAGDALEQFHLERVLFVPAYQAPLKSKSPIASPEHRMEMVKLAIAGEAKFGVSDLDYREQAISYSVKTAARLKDALPDSKLCWILGADQIAQLHHWRDIESLGNLVEFLAFERPRASNTPHPDLPRSVSITKAEGRQLDISSTEIRERLKSGRGAKYFLPEKVFDYIKAHTLYT